MFLGLAAIMMPLCSFSQSSNFSIHAGLAFPSGEFGDDDTDDDDSGLAGVGIDLGGKYIYQLDKKGLSLFGSADLILNGLQSDTEDDLEDNLEDYYDWEDINFYKYINIPVLTGLNYTYNVNSGISIFGEVGLGFNLLKVTTMTFEYDNEDGKMTFDPSTKFAYKIGGGINFKNGLSAELNLLKLGEHELEGETKYDGDTEDFNDYRELNISIATLTIAKRF